MLKKDVSLSNLKMHLIGCWCLQIILIVTTICKDFKVKFIKFIVFSYLNYLLWLVTHICKPYVFNVVLSIALLNSLGLLKK